MILLAGDELIQIQQHAGESGPGGFGGVFIFRVRGEGGLLVVQEVAEAVQFDVGRCAREAHLNGLPDASVVAVGNRRRWSGRQR